MNGKSTSFLDPYHMPSGAGIYSPGVFAEPDVWTGGGNLCTAYGGLCLDCSGVAALYEDYPEILTGRMYYSVFESFVSWGASWKNILYARKKVE